jgi:hypothetical protein
MLSGRLVLPIENKNGLWGIVAAWFRRSPTKNKQNTVVTNFF